jgi:hypothetical protein
MCHAYPDTLHEAVPDFRQHELADTCCGDHEYCHRIMNLAGDQLVSIDASSTGSVVEGAITFATAAGLLIPVVIFTVLAGLYARWSRTRPFRRLHDVEAVDEGTTERKGPVALARAPKGI